MKIILPVFLLLLSIHVSAQNLSNKGKEFWVGYGHNTLFTDNPVIGSNTQSLVLYLSAEQAATVTVSVNGTSYTRTYNIAANTVIQTTALPKTGTTDARLLTEGLNTRGIHIVSNVPIVAYAHQYGNNSSGAMMLMPVETYGYTYYSLNFTQETNAEPAYSWFFVVASENNTKVEITPSAATQGGKAANVTFPVSLNKGEIYNVLGKSFGSTGNDLSGSKVKSVAGADGKCHPVALFSGSSRVVICGASGDIMQQQMFPASAWGTKYLTYPTLNTDDITTTNGNYFRVAVRDPSTVVKRNGVTLTGLTNNFYYEFISNEGDIIEADKPIMVSQYVPSSLDCSLSGGDGDPEMFYLSPLEQAINKASFYSTSNQSITSNYVVIIIKNAGVNSLKVDGSSTFNFSRGHPQNPGYRILIKTLTADKQHIITSDSTFNAVTYGFGYVESYGFNAGTAINNLDLLPAIQNTLSTLPSATTYTCPNAPFKIKIKMAYKPTTMTWKFSQVNNFPNNRDTTLNNPVPIATEVVNSRQYYEFELPTNYTFTDTGSYNVPLSITAPEIDNCNNTLDFVYPIKVSSGPKPGFSYNYSTCLADSAKFQYTNEIGVNVSRWNWSFGDGTTDSVANPKKKFATEGSHTVKLSVITDDGCIGDSVRLVATNKAPVATLNVSPLSACEGSTINLIETSTFGGVLNSWYWDFGNGIVKTTTNNNAQAVIYPKFGTYTIKHVANSSGSCSSDTLVQTIKIYEVPKVIFAVFQDCNPAGTVKFSDSTIINDGQQLKYLWEFNDVNFTSSNPNTSTSKDATHNYTTTGTYTAKLTVTTVNSCTSTMSKAVVVQVPPKASFTSNSTSQCITGNIFNYSNISTGSGPIIYQWSFGDGATATSANASHTYSATGTYTVSLIASNDNGCTDTFKQVVTVNDLPATPTASSNSPLCIGQTLKLSTNDISGANYSWIGPNSYSSTVQKPVISNIQLADAGTYTVVATVNGCKSLATSVDVVVSTLLPAPNITNNSPVCAGQTISLTTPAQSGTTYNWTGPNSYSSTLQNISIPNAANTNAGNYSLTATINGCNTAPAKTTVVVNPVPATPVISSNGPVCLGSTLNLSTASVTSATYLWLGPSNFTASTTTPSIAAVTSANAGLYSVNVTVNGCTSAPGTTTVSILQTPVAPITSSNSPVCTGNSINLTASTVQGATYSWSGPNNFTANVQNPVLLNAVLINQGAYSVTVNVNGCTSAAAMTDVTVNATPVAPEISSNLPVCIGSTINLTTANTAGATYKWTGPGNYSSTLQNPAIANASTANAGTYNLTQTISGCTSAAASTNIVVNNIPVAPTAGNNGPVCAATTLNLTASTISGASYEWTGPNSFTSSVQSPSIDNVSTSAAGSYSVTATVNGCKSSPSTTSAVVKAIPATPAITSNAPICNGSNLQLAATSISGATYLWTGPANFTASTENVAISNATAANDGAYSVKATVNGCSSLPATSNVAIKPIPQSSVVSNNGPVCEGQALNLSALNAAGASYNWIGPNGFISAIQNPVIASAKVVNAGTYTVTATVDGCKSPASMNTVVVKASPVAPTVTVNASICAGNTLRLNASAITGATYNWTGPKSFTSTVQSPLITNATVQNSGVYSVTASANGCKSLATNSPIINVYAQPVVSIVPELIVLQNTPILLNASATGSGLTYVWTPSQYLSSSNVLAPLSNPKEDITYTLTVTGTGGCFASKQVRVKVLKDLVIPNAFSPNGDGINDSWLIKHLEAYPGCTVEVFNRYGSAVYKSIGYSTPWNGGYKGAILPIGTYYYIIDPKNGKERITGSITILK